MAPRRMLYIRDIPVPIRQQISDFLDDPGALRNWRHLAGLLGFSNDDIAAFQRSMQRPGGSPSDEMLTTWDYENHTIKDLYCKLYELRHARCMMLLRDLVDPSLHDLINQIRNNPPPAGHDGDGVQHGNQGRHQPNHLQPNHHQPNQIHPPHDFPQRPPQQRVAPPAFSPNLPAGPPHMPHPNRIPDQAHQQQQQQQECYSNKTPSTASYHSDKHGPFLQPNPGMMRANPPPRESGGAASPHPVPGFNLQQNYHGNCGNYGNNLQRVPSEHPLGSPQMYVSECSNEDNLALPAPSPAAMLACRPPSFGPAPGPRPGASDDSIEQFLKCTLEKPYSEICEATHNFSDTYKLGEGSFGTVYHAQLNMTDYAIKKLKQNDNVRFDRTKARADQIKELSALVKYRGHPNIVSLCFYSIDGDCLCLIYDYLKNGSLEDCLQGRSVRGPLDWKTRHKIAEGAALGINYLHTAHTTPLIHQDIKSANILLGENFEAKIADFGLARPGPKGGKEAYTILKTSTVCGTKAYLPYEFQNRYKLTTKLDVYSFGVVLMEIVTGMRAGDVNVPGFTQKLLSAYVQQIMERYDDDHQKIAEQLRDPACPEWPWHFVWSILDLSMKSTAHNYKERPHMSEVYACLKGLRTQTEEYDRDRSSRRNVVPTENTEPMPYREGEESYVSSSLEDFKAVSPPIKSDEAMPFQRVPSPEAKMKEDQYNGFKTRDDGRGVAEASRRNGHAVEATCHRQLDNQFRQIQIQPNQRPGGQMPPANMPRTFQTHESHMPQRDQYHGAVLGQEGYGAPSRYPMPPPGMPVFHPPRPDGRTPSPVPSYRSEYQSSDVTSSSQATDYGSYQRQQGYNPVPGSQAGYRQYQQNVYMGDASQRYDPRYLGYESPQSAYTTQSSQYSMQAQPDLSRQSHMDEMERRRLYQMAEYNQHPQDLQQKNPVPDGHLTSEQSTTSSSAASNPSSASSSSASSAQDPPRTRYPKMKTIVLRQLSESSVESSVLTENTSLQSLSEQESGGSSNPRPPPPAVPTNPGIHHQGALPHHDGMQPVPDITAQLPHDTDGPPSRVATQNTEPVHEVK